LLVNAVLIPALVNAILNGGIAWTSSKGERAVPLAAVPLLQKPGTMTDTLGTLFILPFVIAIAVTQSVRRDQATGRLPPLEPAPRLLRQLCARLPDSVLGRAVAFGVICLVSLGPLAALAIGLAGFGGITVPTFVVYKMILGVCLGLVITPVIAVTAMVGSSRSRLTRDSASTTAQG